MVFQVSVSAHSNTSACLNSETDAAEHETARHDDGYEGLLGDVLLKHAKEDDGYEGIGLKRANHDDGYEGLLDNVLLKRAKEDDGYEGLGLKRANHDDDGEGADETH